MIKIGLDYILKEKTTLNYFKSVKFFKVIAHPQIKFKLKKNKFQKQNLNVKLKLKLKFYFAMDFLNRFLLANTDHNPPRKYPEATAVNCSLKIASLIVLKT